MNRLSRARAAQLTDLIGFNEIMFFDDEHDFDFNCVVVGMPYDKFMNKVEFVDSEWWREAQIVKH